MGAETVNAHDKHPHVRGFGMASARSRARLVERLRGLGIEDETVLAAIEKVQRHQFVDEAMTSRAYDDTALPIGYGQTISQPWVVARMTELLIADRVPPKVLEIGTGCGYQAAVLSRVAARVHTVEVVEELGRAAGDRFKRLGVDNVYVRIGDGYAGWPEEAPFDAIIVTAAPARIPDALIRQLRPGGRMILPVGRAHDRQTLTRVVKTADGRVRTEPVLSVAFVPMVSARPNDREKKAND
mgnify:CR=1 FL=1